VKIQDIYRLICHFFFEMSEKSNNIINYYCMNGRFEMFDSSNMGKSLVIVSHYIESNKKECLFNGSIRHNNLDIRMYKEPITEIVLDSATGKTYEEALEKLRTSLNGNMKNPFIKPF